MQSQGNDTDYSALRRAQLLFVLPCSFEALETVRHWTSPKANGSSNRVVLSE